jgi:hypothetical protein
MVRKVDVNVSKVKSTAKGSKKLEPKLASIRVVR